LDIAAVFELLDEKQEGKLNLSKVMEVSKEMGFQINLKDV
jgi:hypothetical protein